LIEDEICLEERYFSSLLRRGLIQSRLDCTLGKKRAGAGKRENLPLPSFFLSLVFTNWCLLTGASAEERGSSVIIGGAFEQLFCPEGSEFEQANLQKFKCPGGCPGGGDVELSN